MSEELPTDVRERAVQTARQVFAGDVSEDRLERLLAPHDFVPRIREDDEHPVLVCYPAEWREDGAVRVEAIESLERAFELPLFPGDAEDWSTVADANERVVERVAAQHDETHAANVRAFADFMNNHRARRIANATDADVEEFLSEFYPRNVWSDERAESLVTDSITIARTVAEEL